MNFQKIFRVVCLLGNIVAFIGLSYGIFVADLDFDTTEICIAALLWFFFVGNIYLLAVGDLKTPVFRALGNVWPFIVIRRRTLEEREKIRQIEQRVSETGV